MSARQPFFPQATTRPNSRAEFTPDSQNPLHSSNTAATPPLLSKEGFVSFASSGQGSSSSISNGRPPTSGLGGLHGRRSATTNGKLAPRMSTIRPGTADPQSTRLVKHTEMPPPMLAAPSPQQPERHISSLINQSPLDGFKVPFSPDMAMDTDDKTPKNAHISTSASPLQLRPVSRQSGPQRIPVNEAGKYHAYRQEDSNAAHDSNDNGRVHSMNRQSNKRGREDDEYSDDNFAPYGKRFKSHVEKDDHDNFSSRGNSSPGSASASHRSLHDVDLAEKIRVVDRNSVAPRSPSQSPQDMVPYAAHGSFSESMSRPGALHELIGVDPDLYVKNSMDTYNEMVQQYSNCSVDEWTASADEISKEFGDILNRVKSLMDAKLKLYTKFENTVQSHNNVLNQRQAVLDSAGQRLVTQSGSVLK